MSEEEEDIGSEPLTHRRRGKDRESKSKRERERGRGGGRRSCPKGGTAVDTIYQLNRPDLSTATQAVTARQSLTMKTQEKTKALMQIFLLHRDAYRTCRHAGL